MKAADFLDERKVIGESDGLEPIISVVMPTYQRAASGQLDRALRGVMSQTFQAFELIVVDDGSTDDTEKKVMTYVQSDSRVRYIKHKQNSGLPAIRANEGVFAARGKYIALALDDDILYENALDGLYKYIESDISLDAVYGFVKYYINNKIGAKLLTDSYGSVTYSQITIKSENYIPCNAFLIKRKVLLSSGLFVPHILLRRIADWDFWLRAGGGLNIAHVPVLCGEMHEMQQDSLTRKCQLDVDLICRFAHAMKRISPQVHSWDELAGYEIDYFPVELAEVFSRNELELLLAEMNAYATQTGVTLGGEPVPVLEAAGAVCLRVGLLELGEGFSTEFVDHLARRVSIRYVSGSTPFEEILKNQIILIDGFCEKQLSDSYHLTLRRLLHYVVLERPPSVLIPTGFDDLRFLGPSEQDIEGVMRELVVLTGNFSAQTTDRLRLNILLKERLDLINVISIQDRNITPESKIKAMLKILIGGDSGD